MSYNWIHLNGKTQSNTVAQSSKTRTKRHFPEINAKEKFQYVDSPLNIPLKRTRRSNGDSDYDSDQVEKNEELFSIVRKRPSGTEDNSKQDTKRPRGTEDNSKQDTKRPRDTEDNFQQNTKRLKVTVNEEEMIAGLKKSISSGADVNAIDKNRGSKTVLHFAVQYGYAKVVSYLLKNGADIIADKKGKTPLDLANDLGLNDIVTILETHVQSNLLIDSLQQLRISDEKMPLNEEGQLKKLNQPDKEGNTPLLRAINSCKPEDVNLFVQCGADVNYQNSKTKQRAIDIVWENEDYDTMLALLKVNSYFPQGFTLDALYTDSVIPSELKEFVKKREELHTWIKDDKLIEVSSFVKKRVSKFFNSENKSAQEIAAAHASARTFKATVGIISDDEENILSETQKKLVNQVNSEDDSLLLIAAKNGKKDNIDFLIQCKVDVNYKNPKTKQRAIDIVWENGYYDTMLELLEADSYFPQGFNFESLSSQKELRAFVEARSKLYKSIEEGNLREVKDLIVTDKSKFCFNIQGQSAVLTAIKNKKYEIFAFLTSIGKNYHYEEEQEINVVYYKLSPGEKESLKSIMIHYFPQVEDAHIWYLISKSRARKPIDNFKTKVENFYRKLDAIPEISKLLQVARHIGKLDIIFDFDKEHIEDINPTASKSVRGITDYTEERIYIAAKMQEDKVLGTLAHELTHLAMQVVYKNDCRPYIESDTDKARKFAAITADIKNQENIKQAISTIKNDYNIDDSPIVTLARAFSYPENEQESELIVRIPHILTQYKEEGKKAFINDNNYKELTSYYDSNVVPEYQSYIDRGFSTKPRGIIRSLNQVIGEVHNIQELNIKFQSPINLDYSFDSNKGKPFLLLKSKNTLLSSLSIYQVLQDKSYYADNYLLLKFERYVKYTEQINKAFYFEVNKLLVVEYSNNSDNTKLSNILNTLSELLQQKPQKQVIFIVDESKIDLVKDALSEKLSDKYFEKLDKDYKFSDLTYASQAHILEKQVIFQGKKIILKDIDDNIREVIDTQTLVKLIKNDEIKIGTEPLGVNNLDAFYTKVSQQIPDKNLLRIKNGVNALYVINIIGQSDIEIAKNKLIQKCGITKEDIGKFSLDVAVNHKKKILIQLDTIKGDEFKQLCNNIGNNIEDNKKIYWISWNWKDDKFVLNQCHNTRSFMTRFFYKKDISSNPADFDIGDISESKFLKKISEIKTGIIVGEPGSGKSTIFTKIAADLINLYWVIRINFSKCTNAIAGLHSETSTFVHVIDFLLKIEGLDHQIEKNLLELKLRHSTNAKPLLFLFDGFDEIRGDIITELNIYKLRVISLIKFLHSETKATILVATRDGEKLLLNSNLRAFTYQLKDLTDVQKTSYLEKLWKTPLQLTLGDEQLRVLDDKFKTYSKFVFSRMATILREENPHLLGIPLQLQLFGEGLQSEFVEFIQNNHHSLQPLEIGILGLYKKCIHARYNIFSRDKKNKIVDESEYGIKTLYKDYNKNYWKLAFKEIFQHQTKGLEDKLKVESESLNELLGIGIIQHTSDDNFRFNNPTFAEYFFAVQLMPKLGNPVISEVLVLEVFMCEGSRMIRSFLNEHLKKNFPDDKTLMQYGQKISDLRRNYKSNIVNSNGETMLHIAIKENNYNIVKFLLESMAYDEKIIKEFLCDYTKHDIGVLHLAIKVGNLNIIDLLLETAEKYSVLDDILLAKNNKVNLLDYAILYSDDVVIFDKLFSRVNKKNLSDAAISSIFGNILNTALSVTNEKHFKNVLNKFLGDKDIIKELLLNINGNQGNSLYWACHGQGDDIYNAYYDKKYKNLHHLRQDIFPVKDDTLSERITILVEKLLEYVDGFDKEILKELLVPTGKNKEFLPLHRTVYMKNHAITIKLLEIARSINNDVPKTVLLATDQRGNNLLCAAIEVEDLTMVLQLSNSAKGDTLKDLLNPPNKGSNKPLHLAIYKGSTEIAMKLLSTAKNCDNNNAMLKTVLLSTGKDGKNTLPAAIEKGSTEMVKLLLEYSKSAGKNTLKTVLLSTDKDGKNTLPTAIEKENTEIVKLLLEYSEFAGENVLKSLLDFIGKYEENALRKHEIVKLLFKAATNITHSSIIIKVLLNSKDKKNALRTALKAQSPRMVKWLLDDPQFDGKNALKDLLIDIIPGQEVNEMAILLLDATDWIDEDDRKIILKKLIELVDQDDNAFLLLIAKKGDYMRVTKLLDYANGINDEDARKIILKKILEFVDQDDNTFLHLAARGGNHMVIAKLLKAANNIKAADIKIIRLLNDADAKAIKYLVLFFNRDQETPFRIAVEKEHSFIIKEFLRNTMEIDDNKETFKELNKSIGSLTDEYTTQIKQIMDDFISGRKSKEQVLSSVQNVEPEVQIVSVQSKNTDSIHSIASTCLPSTSRGKRSTNECKIGWDDIDKISSRKTRSSDEIIIDTNKFLAYLNENIGDPEKSKQLMLLAEETRKPGAGKVVGNGEYVLDRITTVGGLKNYLQIERLNDITYNLINSDSNVHTISRLSKASLTALGRIQLLHGIAGTTQGCIYNYNIESGALYCALGISNIASSFVLNPLASYWGPKVISMTSNIGKFASVKLSAKVHPLVLKEVAIYYGKVVTKGIMMLGGVFDVIDISMSTSKLIQCKNRDNTNPCSEKEIRDAWASIGFSSISFISSTVLIAMGAGGPVTIVVGAVIMVSYGVYNGISNVIEYREKYHTIGSEDWSIFWRSTIPFVSMSPDVNSLLDRTDAVNYITDYAWDQLKNSHDGIVGYAAGLGLQTRNYTCDFNIEEQEISLFFLFPDYYKEIGNIAKKTRSFALDMCANRYTVAAKSIIFMSIKAQHELLLSRVVPHSVDGAEMVCLPEFTDSDYEKGQKNSVATAKYFCSNAFVMMHKERISSSKVKDKYIIYDLKYVNSGTINAASEFNGIFYIYDGNVSITGGKNNTNVFVLLGKFTGYITLKRNSTSIFDIGKLKHKHATINMMCDNYNMSFARMVNKIDDESIKYIGIDTCVAQEDVVAKYVSGNNKVDEIVCNYLHGIESNTYNKYIMVDSGGGVGGKDEELDIIRDCLRATIYPFTKFQGKNHGNSIYTLYIKSDGYEGISNTVSTINLTAPTNIVFLEVSLLSNGTLMRYAVARNVLLVETRMQNNGTYTLELENYRNLNKDNSTNYRLVDTIGNTITPNILEKYLHLSSKNITLSVKDKTGRNVTISEDTAVITEFFLYNSCSSSTLPVPVSESSSAQIVHFYQNIVDVDTGYKVFSTLTDCFKRNNSHIIQIGSIGNDVMTTSQSTAIISGGGGSDTYIHNIAGGANAFVSINNFAEDLKLDILSIIAPYNITTTDFKIRETPPHLLLELTTEAIPYSNVTNKIKVQIENYSMGHNYQHIAFMDTSGNAVIPLIQEGDNIRKWVLVPFYHATSQKNTFVLSADDLERAVIDIYLNNIMFYKQDNNLLLFANFTQDSYPLSIIFTDYYTQQQEWQNVELYAYNQGHHSRINLAKVKLSDKNSYEYNNLIQEYIVDFNDPVKSIRLNNTLLQSGSEIPVMIFKDIAPNHLQVQSTIGTITLLDIRSNHTLQIINWHHNQYPIIFEFNPGLRPIRIYLSDKNSISDLQSKISAANWLYIDYKSINYRSENILKCLMSPRITNINEGYTILGFHSPEHQEMFIAECNSATFRMDDLTHYNPLVHLRMLSNYEILRSNNDTIVNIIKQDINPVAFRIFRKTQLNSHLERSLGKIPLRTVHAVECLLKVYCDQSYDYDIEGSILGKLIYNILVDYIDTMKENNKDLTCDGEEQYLTSNDSSKALMLLILKIYCEVKLKYPDIEEDTLYNNCFNTILSDSHISGMLKYLNDNGTVPYSDIDNFVDSNYQDIQLIGSNNNRLINITELFEALDLEVNDTMHSGSDVIDTSHGGNYNRERRDIGDHSTRRKRELNREFKKEESNIVDKDNYSDQASTEHKNTDTKSNDWVSWREWPKFNIFPGAEAAGTENIVINQQEYKPVDNTSYNTDVVIEEDYHAIDRGEIHKDIAEDLLVEDNKATEAESSSNMLVDNVTTVFTNGIFPGAEAAGTENIVINQQEYKPVDNTVYNTDVVIGENYHSINRSEIHKDIAEGLLVEDNKATEAESSSNMLVDNVTTVFTNGMNLFKGTISKISKLISNITNSNSSNYPSDELSVNDNTDYIVRNKATNAASSLAIDDGSNNNNIQEVTTGFDLHGTLILGQYVISKKLGPNNSLSSKYITPKQKHTMEVNKLAATILPFLQNDDFINIYNNQPQWYRDVYKDEFDKIVGKRDYRDNQKDIYKNNSSEEILADSISIFGETTVYENNDRIN